MINYLIRIIKLLEEINMRLDKLENKDKCIIGTRFNRVIRPTIRMRGIR